MSGFLPSLDETQPFQMVRGIRDLSQGRSNAFGTFTLTANAATTTVAAPNCAPESCISLMPLTAHASAEMGAGTIYIASATVTQGQFVVTHANNAQVDRTYRYAIQG